MPEGPLGFPRFSTIGPLTNKTDIEVAGAFVQSSDLKRKPESAIRRTILELISPNNGE